jgi:hypothetical protein
MDFEIAAKERKERKISIFDWVPHRSTALKLLIFCALCVLLRLFFVVSTRTFFNPESLFAAVVASLREMSAYGSSACY